MRILTLSLLSILFAGLAFADDDAEGCKDSPLVKRVPRSWISTCDHKEFDERTFVVKSTNDGEVEKSFEGEVWEWRYILRDGMSDLQVFRNFQTAFQSAGFNIVYTHSPDYLVARKGDTLIKIDTNGADYNQYVVQVKSIQQEVTADASTLKDALDKSGRVSVYGINFETGKAAIAPESEVVLGQVQKLLEDNDGLKVRIEGHTDNVGAATANQALSMKRAQAVVGWLLAHGIDAGRLNAQGFGDTEPLAENATEEGRAKNRRVDLVKQ